MLLIKEVSKLFNFNEVKDLQSENINFAFITFEVSKFFNPNNIKLSHEKKIIHYYTFFVLKADKSIKTNETHEENIPFISFTFEVSISPNSTVFKP